MGREPRVDGPHHSSRMRKPQSAVPAGQRPQKTAVSPHYLKKHPLSKTRSQHLKIIRNPFIPHDITIYTPPPKSRKQ